MLFRSRVWISSRQVDSQVEVTVRDNGKGLSREQLAGVFDPGFYVEGGQVRSRNWGLFSSRQIVREHGGKIGIRSREGRGTTVTVSLPPEEESKARLARHAAERPLPEKVR